MSVTSAMAARALHGLIEPIHTTMYFAPEIGAAFEAIGLDPRGQGYFAGRAAPMGRVEPGPVAASFYNFNPGVVASFFPAVWEIASPTQILEARASGIQAMYDNVKGPTDTLENATAVTADALRGADLAGRPLAFANAAVPVPAQPFAALWQYLAVLREHRGDGHTALLTSFGIDPVEALVMYASWQGRVSRRFLQGSRIWDDEAWVAGQERCRERGWMDAQGELTQNGRLWRDGLETETDRLASRPYDVLGESGARWMFELLHPMATAIAEGGVYPKPLTLPATFDDALAG
ncbi:MAG: hypothetical protein ACI867_001393 [Glaciecola sp.]